MSVPSPTFRGKKELARYIHPTERDGDNHAASSAFLLDSDNLSHAEPHLSVNSTETESLADIANYYRDTLQDAGGEVAICVHQVNRYVDAGRHAGTEITASHDHAWVFNDKSGELPAFKHRPVQPHRKSESGSPSHCGVEFLRSLSDLNQHKFARRMAKSPRFHLL